MNNEITSDQAAIAGDLWFARLAGKGGGAVRDEYLADAESLRERGWVNRRMQAGEPIYEISDAGMVALELGGLRRNQPADFN